MSIIYTSSKGTRSTNGEGIVIITLLRQYLRIYDIDGTYKSLNVRRFLEDLFALIKKKYHSYDVINYW